jgi:hypothetical protein
MTRRFTVLSATMFERLGEVDVVYGKKLPTMNLMFQQELRVFSSFSL